MRLEKKANLMNSRQLAYSLLAGLTVFSFAQHAWYWSQLPEKVATHFGIDGQPNDWMSRDSATIVLAGFQVIIPLMLISITSAARRLPDSMINIPNRDYWLTGDRRNDTLAYVSTMMAWIAVMTAAFMSVIAHLTFRANTTGVGLNMPVFGTALVTYLAAVFTIAGFSLRRFRVPRL